MGSYLLEAIIESPTGQYSIHLFILVGLYLLLSLSLNIAFGYGKLFDLAHVAIFGIGAYSSALILTRTDLGFPFSVVFGMAVGALVSVGLSFLAIRLKNDYFAICTLAVASLIHAVMVNWKGLTGGVLGVPGIPRPKIAGVAFSSNEQFLSLVAVLVAVSLVFFFVLEKSAICRSLRAQSEFEFGAQAMGISPVAVRTRALILASLFSSLAGSLFACYLNYIDPSSFTLAELIFLFSIVIVGKPGSVVGIIIATFFLVLLPEELRFRITEPGILGPMRQLVAAIILFLFVYARRNSLFPPERKI